MDALPALALVATSWLVLLFEYRLFKPINDAYVDAQKEAISVQVRQEGRYDLFAWVVCGYPGLLLVLLGVVAAVVWTT